VGWRRRRALPLAWAFRRRQWGEGLPAWGLRSPADLDGSGTCRASNPIPTAQAASKHGGGPFPSDAHQDFICACCICIDFRMEMVAILRGGGGEKNGSRKLGKQWPPEKCTASTHTSSNPNGFALSDMSGSHMFLKLHAGSLFLALMNTQTCAAMVDTSPCLGCADSAGTPPFGLHKN